MSNFTRFYNPSNSPHLAKFFDDIKRAEAVVHASGLEGPECSELARYCGHTIADLVAWGKLYVKAGNFERAAYCRAAWRIRKGQATWLPKFQLEKAGVTVKNAAQDYRPSEMIAEDYYA